MIIFQWKFREKLNSPFQVALLGQGGWAGVAEDGNKVLCRWIDGKWGKFFNQPQLNDKISFHKQRLHLLLPTLRSHYQRYNGTTFIKTISKWMCHVGLFSHVFHKLFAIRFVFTCMWTNAEGRQTNISWRYKLVWAKTWQVLSPSPQTHAWTPTLQKKSYRRC